MKKTAFKERRFLLMVLVMLAVSVGPAFWPPSRQAGTAGWQVHTGEPVVRLHVRAAGDRPAEQRFKMDLVARVQKLLSENCPPEVCSIQGYLDFLQGYRPELERSLQEFALAAAEVAPISVELARETFPLRSYGRRIYPAGEYTALAVIIGEGAGENWWCLLFPSLCLPPARAGGGTAECDRLDQTVAGSKKKADSVVRARSAIFDRWRIKVWEMLKRPGQYMIEKAGRIFYN